MERRLLILKYVFITIFWILIARLFTIQIIYHKAYLRASQNNIYLNIRKAALRADIRDRNGAILATSNPLFKLSFSGTTAELEHIQNILLQNGNNAYIQHNCLIVKNLKWEQVVKIFSISSIPVPEIEIDQVRTYPLNAASAHIIGYLQNVYENEYKGTNGVEKLYDKILAGTPGKDVFLINAKRHRLNKQKTIEAQSAQAIYLSIDSNLQKAAYEALAERKQGAIMIINAQTGEILAATSYPSFNPEYFSDKASEQKTQAIKEYYQDALKPLFNLFLNAAYPPGSTIKPFMLVAMLKKGVPKEYYCTGSYNLGKNTFHCLGNHKSIDARRALFASCNCFFYAFSQYLSQEDLAFVWKEFGLGEPILSELNKKYPKFPHKENWKLIDSLFMQIGQGATLVTLAQLVRAYARLGTGKKIDISFLKQEIQQPVPDLEIAKEYLDPVRQALYDTVNTPGGTAFWQYKPIEAAGKTGTAQVLKLKKHEYRRSNEMREWQFRDHALFCAYAPADNPKVCGCIIIMHGGKGYTSARPLLKLLDMALEIYKEPEEPKNEVTAAAKETEKENISENKKEQEKEELTKDSKIPSQYTKLIV